jgi:hypothetical protein
MSTATKTRQVMSFAVINGHVAYSVFSIVVLIKILCYYQMKRRVKWRRRRASMPSSGMSLANRSSWASSKMQLTGTALPSFLDLKGSSLSAAFHSL